MYYTVMYLEYGSDYVVFFGQTRCKSGWRAVQSCGYPDKSPRLISSEPSWRDDMSIERQD